MPRFTLLIVGQFIRGRPISAYSCTCTCTCTCLCTCTCNYTLGVPKIRGTPKSTYQRFHSISYKRKAKLTWKCLNTRICTFQNVIRIFMLLAENPNIQGCKNDITGRHLLRRKTNKGIDTYKVFAYPIIFLRAPTLRLLRLLQLLRIFTNSLDLKNLLGATKSTFL